jgi:hypothetical protein
MSHERTVGGAIRMWVTAVEVEVEEDGLMKPVSGLR